MTIDVSGGDGVSLVDLVRDHDPILLDQFYNTILVPSFAAAELVPLGRLQQAVTDPEGSGTRVILAVAHDGGPIAGIVGVRYAQSRVMLGAYLAVRQDLRGRGIGSQLLNEAMKGWRESLKPLLVVGEVDDPRHFAVDTERGDPVARLKLYERLGAKVLGMPYFQPTIRQDLGRVHGMLLLALHADPGVIRSNGGRELIDGEVIGRFLREYFTACEGPSCLDDPELRQLLALTARPEGVALLAAGSYNELSYEEVLQPGKTAAGQSIDGARAGGY